MIGGACLSLAVGFHRSAADLVHARDDCVMELFFFFAEALNDILPCDYRNHDR